MTYLKHQWKYYKEINLESLTKEELIELIQNAIVVASTTAYVDHTYRWRNTSQWRPYITSDSNTTTTLNLSALRNEGNESLINLAKSIT